MANMIFMPIVQGVTNRINRQKLRRYSGGSGNPLPCGLGDVSHGETVYFSPLAEVTVDIPETLPLSIFTAGVEVDNCGRNLSDTQVAPDKIMAILKQPEETWARQFNSMHIFVGQVIHTRPYCQLVFLISMIHWEV